MILRSIVDNLFYFCSVWDFYYSSLPETVIFVFVSIETNLYYCVDNKHERAFLLDRRMDKGRHDNV